MGTLYQCECLYQSEFVNADKMAKPFPSPRQHKTVGRETVIAISQEMTSEKRVSLGVDERRLERGMTEYCSPF